MTLFYQDKLFLSLSLPRPPFPSLAVGRRFHDKDEQQKQRSKTTEENNNDDVEHGSELVNKCFDFSSAFKLLLSNTIH